MSSSKSKFNLSKMWRQLSGARGRSNSNSNDTNNNVSRQLENNRRKGKQKYNYNSNSSNNNVSRQLENVIKKFKSKIKHADINGLLRISNQKEWKSLSLVSRRKIIKDRKKHIINSVEDGLCKMKNRRNIELKLHNILNTDFINYNDYNTLIKTINKKFNLDAKRKKIKREIELDKLKKNILNTYWFSGLMRLPISFTNNKIENDMKKMIISTKPHILKIVNGALSIPAPVFIRENARNFVNSIGKNHYLFNQNDINRLKRGADRNLWNRRSYLWSNRNLSNRGSNRYLSNSD